MAETRFKPDNLGPAARLGWEEPGIQEYVSLGMHTRKQRSIETFLVTIGSARRIADATGIKTPIVEMSVKEVRSLVAEIMKPQPPPVLRDPPLDLRLPREDRRGRRGAAQVRADARPDHRPAREGHEIGPDDILTINEINALIDAAASKRDQVLVAALYEAGGRVTEVLSLNVESLKRHENGRAWYEGWIGKMKEQGTGHNVYFREAATVALLDRWLADYPAEVVARPRPLIPSLSFAANAEQRLVADSVGDLLDDLAEAAGITRVHVHAHLFRHTRATMLLREGVPEHVIKRVNGWKPNSPMLARYAHLVTADERRVLGLLGADEGQRAELRVPEKEVPTMPSVPFPASPMVNARIADLEKQVSSLTDMDSLWKIGSDSKKEAADLFATVQEQAGQIEILRAMVEKLAKQNED